MTLLKNSDGKILRNSGGKVLKQNYNHGKAFFDKWITVPVKSSIDIFDDQFTMLGVIEKLESGVVGFLAYKLSSGNIYYYSSSGTNQSLISKNDPTLELGAFNWSTQKYWMYFARTNTSFEYGHQSTDQTFNFSPENLRINEFFLGKKNNVNGYGNIAKCSELIIYDRLISDLERKYWHNNDLGNAPLSTNGLKIRLLVDLAEILDFSEAQDGSDMRVGVKDISGNLCHGEINGLPAGTLEEQRDFANQNYFQIW